MIDSGADESVFPASAVDRSNPRSSDLVAANGSTIYTYGRRILPISFRAGHSIQHEFWIADVSRPLLGASFFREHGLMIDLRNQRLVDHLGTTFSATSSRLRGINGLRLPTSGPYEAILDEFPSLLTPHYTGAVSYTHLTLPTIYSV